MSFLSPLSCVQAKNRYIGIFRTFSIVRRANDFDELQQGDWHFFSLLGANASLFVPLVLEYHRTH